MNIVVNPISRLLLMRSDDQINNASLFRTRVQNDGGTFEAISCLNADLAEIVSFYDDATFLLTPNAVKVSKIYSLKPISGAADFVFARSTTAVRNGVTLIEDQAINLPRLDYQASCPPLRIEPSRTNLFLRSQEFDNASWVKSESTVSANTINAPDGTLTGDSVLETVANANHSIAQAISKTTAIFTYTYSMYVKPNGRQWIRMQIQDGGNGARAWFDIINGVVGTSGNFGAGWSYVSHSIKLSKDGWYRLEISVTCPFGGTSVTGRTAPESANGSVATYVGDITKGFYAWGAQFEESRFASSYKVTTAASANRGADVISPVTSVSSLIGQTEGTLFFRARTWADSTLKYGLIISDGSTNNRIYISFNASNQVQADVISGGVTQATLTNAFTSETDYNIALTYQANKAALFINGAKISEDLTVTVPACSRLGFDRGDGSTSPFYGHIKMAFLLDEALTDAEAEGLTGLFF